MLNVTCFVFNPFQENTYVIDNGSQAMIIDPGCFDQKEREELRKHLSDNGLEPVYCINTHCHLDHIFGNGWVHDEYGLAPQIHRDGVEILNMGKASAELYGLPYDPSPEPGKFIEPGENYELGEDQLEVLFVPGHCPGHIALYNPECGFVIAGDVLFQRSIGRTDLPGGDMSTLLASIKDVLFALPDGTLVYCGHGPTTTIGEEKRGNPFLI